MALAASARRSTGATTQVAGETTQVTTQVAGETTQVACKTTQVTRKTTLVAKMLRVMKGEMSVEVLQKSMGISDRRDFSRRYLAPALRLGYIEMTQPASPRSPTQKYRITKKGALWQGNQ